MKLKKLLTVLLTSMLLLTLSTSVFASDVSPTAVGVGDTRESATSFILNSSNKAEYSLFLQSSSDEDWYKWTNTTNKTRIVGIQCQSTDSNTASRIGIQYDYGNGVLSSLMYADSSGQTSNHYMTNIAVPPGSTIYVVLDAPNSYGVHPYKINFILFAMTI